MAKREVPEINAGSMADIAFLLLIFFLVTTTMDKDQAFLRAIPKIVVNPPEPEPIENRDICAIKANSNNQLLFRDQLLANPDDISEKVIEYYRYNEAKNDLSSNYPLYTRISLKEIEEKMAIVEAEIERMESTPDQSEDILKYRYEEFDAWQKKYDALKLYGKQSLPEVSAQAHVRVEVQKKTSYELFAKIHTEIQEAIYTLRNDASMKLWNTSYGVITKRVDLDPKNTEDKAKLELLKLLYNVNIVEVTPKN